MTSHRLLATLAALAALGLAIPAAISTATAQEGPRPGGPGQDHGALARHMMGKMDTNRDGQISRDEFRATRIERFKTADLNGDGYLTAAESATALSEQIRKRKQEKMQQRMARRLALLDTDKDGRVSQSEFEAAGERTFLWMDSDKDGALSGEELPRPPKHPMGRR
jgi:Ca2+-binding EF-hand superfamily protein